MKYEIDGQTGAASKGQAQISDQSFSSFTLKGMG